jgi:hypothetical protein
MKKLSFLVVEDGVAVCRMFPPGSGFICGVGRRANIMIGNNRCPERNDARHGLAEWELKIQGVTRNVPNRSPMIRMR